MKFQNERVLVLAPHTDDGEFGCGGTISYLVESGCTVYYAAFSACRQSVLKELPPDILITEVKAATRILGILPQHLILFDFEVRTFSYRRQEILEELVKLKTELDPDIVFMPSANDIHQDHYVIAFEGMRAFKFKTIFSYEIPWNNFTFNTSAFFCLNEDHINRKVRAIAEYRSQARKTYANEEFIRSLARTRGVQVGCKYAETFDVVRWVIQ